MTRIARSRPARRPRPISREVWMYVIDPPKLQRRRKTKGLTQADLAIFARCTQQYISILESGRDRDCSEDIAMRISKALDIELEDYFEAREVVRMPSIATPSRAGRNDGSAA
jgi:putative transcriptional regulator